jgi:hypothetical protein
MGTDSEVSDFLRHPMLCQWEEPTDLGQIWHGFSVSHCNGQHHFFLEGLKGTLTFFRNILHLQHAFISLTALASARALLLSGPRRPGEGNTSVLNRLEEKLEPLMESCPALL